MLSNEEGEKLSQAAAPAIAKKKTFFARIWVYVLLVIILIALGAINAKRNSHSALQLATQAAIAADSEPNRRHAAELAVAAEALRVANQENAKLAEKIEEEKARNTSPPFTAGNSPIAPPPPTSEQIQAKVEAQRKSAVPARDDENIVWSNLTTEECEALGDKLRKWLSDDETQGYVSDKYGKVQTTWKLDKSSVSCTIGRGLFAVATVAEIIGEKGVPDNRLNKKFSFTLREIDKEPRYVKIYLDEINRVGLSFWYFPEGDGEQKWPIPEAIMTSVLNEEQYYIQQKSLRRALASSTDEFALYQGMFNKGANPANNRDPRNLGFFGFSVIRQEQ